eukprot:gb/GECG01011881.1/.p1 GENE.gb/GECG01011881.1/~~gb/GECG01011881.1/.p1  ORF type:complete len:888 (+),score=147.22 gb/GECG01011881.1/:1-2664(+)
MAQFDDLRSDALAVCYNVEGGIVSPTVSDKVFREECAFTFDTPLSEKGIYTNIMKYYSVAHDLLLFDHQKTGCAVYVHQKWTKTEEQQQKERQAESQKLTKVGIGVEGGAPLDDEPEYDKKNSVVVLYNLQPYSFALDDKDLPPSIAQAARAILSHDDASKNLEVQQAAWEEEIPVTKYASTIEQLADAPRISPDPSTWKCQYCDMRENLWLNLSTGFIGCGRRQFDGSGGNSHALQHFEETGKKYPLCVKLGTITPDGKGDCFSYATDEDSLVEDPKLPEHLQHFGIEVKQMEKTEKTMAELTLDLNQRAEFNSIQEEGSRLVPLADKGLIGMKNLGNSCYMNSVYQVLFSLPEVRLRLLGAFTVGDDVTRVFSGVSSDPATDFACQLRKLAVGLQTDRYVTKEATEALDKLQNFLDEKPDVRQRLLSGEEIKDSDTDMKEAERLRQQASKLADSIYVTARMLKAVVGRNHPEFATNRQQDATEFLQYTLERMERIERAGQLDNPSGGESGFPAWLSRMFSFEMETRTQCQQTNKVKYDQRTDNLLMLQIPKEEHPTEQESTDSTKRQKTEPSEGTEVENIKQVPFQRLLDNWKEEELVDDFLSPATNQRGRAGRKTGIKTFPRYLWIGIGRYVIGENWQPTKINVRIKAPEQLDLTNLKGAGKQPGEEELEDQPENAGNQPQPDPQIVQQLVSMGFPENGCKRAAVATNNASAEQAAEWVMQHMEDPDFDTPLEETTAAPQQETGVDEETVSMLTSMGFQAEHARRALRETNGDPERAGDWLLSHAEKLNQEPAGSAGGESGTMPELEDGKPEYQLAGFISHIGKNTGTGHYVCHIKHGDKWVIMNDRTVAESVNPPLDLGYLYLYRRVDAPSPSLAPQGSSAAQ